MEIKGKYLLLFVWSIIILLVTLTLLGNIGKETSRRIYDFENEKVIFVKGTITLETLYPYFILEIIFSILFYIIISLDGWEKKNGKNSKT